MANLTIKNLPDRVREELRKAARSQGKSLNAYIIALLQDCVDERLRRRLMRQERPAFRKFLSSLPRLGDSSRLIHEDRERRH